jgi:hypothetical protein
MTSNAGASSRGWTPPRQAARTDSRGGDRSIDQQAVSAIAILVILQLEGVDISWCRGGIPCVQAMVAAPVGGVNPVAGWSCCPGFEKKWPELCTHPPSGLDTGQRRFITKHWIIDLNQLETKEPNWRLRRVQAQAEKRQRRIEMRRQAELAASNRAAAQIRLLTANIEAEVASLDARITADLEVAVVKDPAHPAFSVSTKAMITRRDNLKSTIRALSERARSIA